MSNSKGFRTSSNSYGQFWFGGNSFPGFLYKKNMGVGGAEAHNLLQEEQVYVINLTNFGTNIHLEQV